MSADPATERSERKPRMFGLWVTAGCSLLPLLYVLSIGMLIRLEGRGQLHESMLQPAVAYSVPYNWVCDHLPDPLRPAVEKFEELWLP